MKEKKNRDNIIEYCEKYLEVDKFDDGCCNGLQVEGKGEIKKIVTGVSLSKKLIEAAIEKKADMIMVHHGLFDNYIEHPISIRGMMRNRLKKILSNNINLAGFHLPLDAHKEIGNNIAICKMLGIKDCKNADVGYIGKLDKEIDFDKFVGLVDEKLETNSHAILAGPDKVKTVAVISGGASPDYQKMLDLGADTFITGDLREQIVREVEEVGINIINAGHYNTEKIGIINLGELVAREFGVDVEFVDVPNSV